MRPGRRTRARREEIDELVMDMRLTLSALDGSEDDLLKSMSLRELDALMEIVEGMRLEIGNERDAR